MNACCNAIMYEKLNVSQVYMLCLEFHVKIHTLKGTLQCNKGKINQLFDPNLMQKFNYV